MTVTIVNGSRATGAVASAGFDEAMDLATGAGIGIGNYLILVCSYDNSGTSGVDPNMFVATSSAVDAIPGRDLRGNNWYRVAKSVRTSGVANDGAVADIWICRVNNAYSNGDDITVQWSFPAAAFVYRIFEVAALRPINYSIVTPNTYTGSATSIAAVAAPTLANQLVVGVAAWETNTAVTVDSDTTDGSWVTINNSGYNSGVDATSQTLVSQAKIVTGTSVQNWNLSKTGAADYAALTVIFDTFTSVPPTYMSGNTHYPCPAGPEILPVGNARFGIDVGTEYLFTHDAPPNYNGSQTYAPITQIVLDASLPSSSIQQHVVSTDLYNEGDELAIDTTESVVLYVSAAAGSTGSVVVGGGTVADAIATVGGAYVQLPPLEYVDVAFDPSLLTTLYPNYRVLRWGVRYVAWKDDSSPATPGEGIQLEWRDSRALGGPGGQFVAATAGAFSPGAFLVNTYRYQAGYELRWAGETNLIPRAKTALNALTAASGASFTVEDLERMASGAGYETGIRLYGRSGEDPLQTDIFLDYVEMVVELVPERRVGTGMRKVSTETPVFYPSGLNGSYWFDPNDSAFYMTLDTTETKVMTVREALPASQSDYYAAKTNISGGARVIGDTEAVGPTLQLGGMDIAWDSLSPQPNLRRASLSGGTIASPPTELDTAHAAATAVDLMSLGIDGSVWPAYGYFDPGDLGTVTSSQTALQYILVDGATTYDAIKVLVRPDTLTTANLTISVQQPLATPIATATITLADVASAPKYGNDDWAEVIVPLSVPITPSAGYVVIEFSTLSDPVAPWYVSTGLADSTIYAYDINDPADQEWDYAVVLLCEMDDPDVTLGTATYSIPPSGFAGAHCVATSIDLPEITFNNADDFDYISIERIVGGSVTPVVVLEGYQDTDTWVDYGAPWDLGPGAITYQVTGYRLTDHRITTTVSSAYANDITAPGAAFGLASEDGLWVYAPTSDSSELEVTYNPLNPISKVQLHGYNYQVALRSPEERGVEVSVPVLVDSLGCVARSFETSDGADETASQGQQAMSPTPFDPIRALEEIKRHMLLLPGGHFRYVILDAGQMTVRTVSGTYIAEIELTDALGPNIAPWS